MICKDLILKMGYECFKINDSLTRVLSPFTYHDDGEHIGVFIHEINGGMKVSDRCDALMNMEARGIEISKKRLNIIKSLLVSQGLDMNDRGEIIAFGSYDNIGEMISNVIKGGVITSVISLDWYKKHADEDKFEKIVINYLKSSNIKDRLFFRQKLYGMSGHEIVAPVKIAQKNSSVEKYLFTSSINSNSGWNRAYSLFGQIVDLKYANLNLNNRYVVIDSDCLDKQLNQLTVLFNDSAVILPYHLRDNWIHKIAS
ncbi:DUF1828 domain-containing protein [Thorsellia kenyensis]|uniref:DUF1828 domain-containing protein n=1 Tax=Thorsellia kenyensis TaxID=1549888 RepID=A0ABV6C7M2_9GAMM